MSGLQRTSEAAAGGRVLEGTSLSLLPRSSPAAASDPGAATPPVHKAQDMSEQQTPPARTVKSKQVGQLQQVTSVLNGHERDPILL